MKLYFYNSQPTDYAVTEDGKVYSYKTNKFLKGRINKSGYVTVSVSMADHVKKNLYVHRMVMETFAPIPNFKQYEVNHKNANKQDNRLENLEWCTHQENLQHSIDNQLRSHQEVYAFDKNKQLVNHWDSLAQLQRATGWAIGNISYNCKQEKRRMINGYYWSFFPDNDFQIATVTTGKAKRIGQYDFDGKLIKIYPSRSAAAKELQCQPSHLSEACNGKLKSYKGFVWKYLTDDIVCSHKKL